MISWIKLDVNILDDTKIKIIRKHPDGDKVVVLWIGLLCLAMKSHHPGTLELSDGLPYTIDDLANIFDLEKKTVEMGLALFCKYQMIEIFDGGVIEVINFAKHQKLEDIQQKNELTRLRMIKYRERKRICDADVTRNGVTVTLTDKDLHLHLNKDKRSFIENSDEFRLAELLFSKIKQHNPGFKPPNLQKWAIHIDKLIRIDKRAPLEIEQVIKWCQADTFWQTNILSTDKLRQKYDQLNTKRLAENNDNKSGLDTWLQKKLEERAERERAERERENTEEEGQ